MKKPFAIALSLGFLFNLSAPPGETCSFGGGPYFTYTLHPDFPMSKYAAGQLGILDHNYARSYLMVAYRYLANKPSQKTSKTVFLLYGKSGWTPPLPVAQETPPAG